MEPAGTYPGFTPTSDPLSASGVRRLDMSVGTQVRLHAIHGGEVDVPLLGIAEVATWSELAYRITHNMPLTVDLPRRMAFGGGVVLWAEDVTQHENG